MKKDWKVITIWTSLELKQKVITYSVYFYIQFGHTNTQWAGCTSKCSTFMSSWEGLDLPQITSCSFVSSLLIVCLNHRRLSMNIYNLLRSSQIQHCLLRVFSDILTLFNGFILWFFLVIWHIDLFSWDCKMKLM
jgi:hypothetical protein